MHEVPCPSGQEKTTECTLKTHTNELTTLQLNFALCLRDKVMPKLFSFFLSMFLSSLKIFMPGNEKNCENWMSCTKSFAI